MMVMGEVAVQDAAQMPLAEDENVIQALAWLEPIRRSTKGFCQGLCGAARTSSIPMPLTRWRNCYGTLVTVPQEIGRSGVVREGVQDLLSGPEGGGDAHDVGSGRAPRSPERSANTRRTGRTA